MARFNIVVLSRFGNCKYQYSDKSFPSIQAAIQYYEMNGGRVIEAKELRVRLKPVNLEESE